MEIEELESKEKCLRKCYAAMLERLDVGGTVTVEEAKRVRLYGGLWHHAHELLKAEKEADGVKHGMMTADTMELKASGLKSMK